MYFRQHNNEVYLKWCQDDDWNSKSLTKMSQGFHNGDEEDRLNLEYFRYANMMPVAVNNSMPCCHLGVSWTCFLACVMADNTWPFHR